MPLDTNILYIKRRKLKKQKFEHVMSLATNYVPASDNWFYEKIKNFHQDFLQPEERTSCSEFEDDN